MPVTKTSEVDQYKADLSPDQKRKWLTVYSSARSARITAGFDPEDGHVYAIKVANSRVGSKTSKRDMMDTELVPVLIMDELPMADTEDAVEVKRRWPSPGKGAPRNRYGGFNPRGYGDPDALNSGKTAWLDSWKVYLDAIEDVELFDGIQSWLWAMGDAVKGFSSPDGLWDTPAREADLPDSVKVFSKPSDYGMKAWEAPPEGDTKLSVSLPSGEDLADLMVAFQAERKRKEIDGLLREDVLRVDYAEAEVVRFDEDTGVLVVDTPIAQLTVLPYSDGQGGVVHELLHPTDFATAAFLNGIPGKPITDGHPGRAMAMMDEDDQAELSLGWTHKDPKFTRVDGDRIWTREVVYDQQLIEDILAGKKRQVSVGRRVLVKDETGTYNGLPYQRRQVDPIFDHLAHVPLGRCGSACAVPRTDRMDAVQVIEQQGGNTHEGMEGGQTMTDKARTYQLTEDVVMTFCGDASEEDVTAWTAALNKLKTDAAETAQLRTDKEGLESQVSELQTKADKAEGTADGTADVVKALQTKVDELEGKLAEAGNQTLDRMDAAIDERLALVRQAEVIVGDEYEFSGKDAKTIRMDILKHLDPKFDPTDRSDDYIQARFDVAVATFMDSMGEPTGNRSLRGDDGEEGREDAAVKLASARTSALHRTAPMKE